MSIRKAMPRRFNIAGPIDPVKHYAIDPFSRIDWPEFEDLIDCKQFFVLHAPRQSGKTTLLDAIVQRLNAEGRYVAMRVSVSSARGTRDDLDRGNRMIANVLVYTARQVHPQSWLATEGASYAQPLEPGTVLMQLLGEWAHRSPKPVVLLIDEIDTLSGSTLESVLTQLRDGYIARPLPFAHSVVLCGVRDVRDYHIETPNGVVTGSSCFNIKAASIRLGNFTEAEVRALYAQHTDHTGQRFDESIFPLVMQLTGGQPWLVNALADELTRRMPELQDRSRTIAADHVEEAKEHLIKRRETHIDDLYGRLRDPTVRRVIAAILNGDEAGHTPPVDDTRYVEDLGLVVTGDDGASRIANAIYQEVIPRALTATVERDIAIKLPASSFVLPDGRLSFRTLIESFQLFYRENSDEWSSRTMYPEAAPHILLQAWLMRLVNGGGIIQREYALGRKRADIFVRHFYMLGGLRREQRFVMEMKVVRKGRSVQTAIREGLEQTAAYADTCSPEEAHLLIVDQRGDSDWEKRVFVAEHTVRGRTITLWGM